MTRNQKIALGCGGAGCLGLIVVAIAGGLLYYFLSRSEAYRAARDYEFNVNVNRNSNSTDDSNSNSDSSNSNSDSSVSSLAEMSDDDKHKLFQAATMTTDGELINRVNVKLGLWKEDYTPADEYTQFAKDHAVWIFRNMDFIQSLDTPEKARAYVDEHLPE